MLWFYVIILFVNLDYGMVLGKYIVC